MRCFIFLQHTCGRGRGLIIGPFERGRLATRMACVSGEDEDVNYRSVFRMF